MSRSARLHADGKMRCPWPGEDPFYMAYHDTEWGVPEYDDRALYEKLILDGFQAGLSWITILRKRENFRKAFDDFQPEKIARYNEKKVHALMNDAGIVRNRAKIEGTVNSAKAYLKIMEEGPGFSKFL
jgi:DNA-3-methyladenine glycosylase I